MITIKQTLNGSISQKKQSLTGKLNYVEKERTDFRTQEKEVSPITQEQEVCPDLGYDGLSKVTVNAVQVQSKSTSPTTETQTIVPDEGYWLSSVEVGAMHKQEKSVAPTRTVQTVTPDTGYDGLSSVTVGMIPSNLVDTSDANAVPINIRSDKSAYVNGQKVDGILPVLTYPVNPSNPSDFSYQFIAATAASKVVRDGTTYVMGAYQVATEQQPDSWMFEGNRKMKLGIPQNKVATAINLKSSQIKSGQTVLGVAGATQGTLDVTTNGQYNVINYDNVNVNIQPSPIILPNGTKFRTTSSTQLDFLSDLDTSQMTDMKNMFSECTNLTSINLENFNTSQVTMMNNMFYYCSSLTSLDVSSFDVSKVTNMWGMFDYCTSLISLDLSNFEPTNIQDMGSMFLNCKNLVNLNVDNFDLSKIPYISRLSSMFKLCGNLSNNSLNSILKMLSTATQNLSNKTLAELGLSQTQAETCQTLSNWSMCTGAGWTTGY